MLLRIILQQVFAADGVAVPQLLHFRFTNFRIGGEHQHLMAGLGKILFHQVIAVGRVETTQGRVDRHG